MQAVLLNSHNSPFSLKFFTLPGSFFWMMFYSLPLEFSLRKGTHHPAAFLFIMVLPQSACTSGNYFLFSSLRNKKNYGLSTFPFFQICCLWSESLHLAVEPSFETVKSMKYIFRGGLFFTSFPRGKIFRLVMLATGIRYWWRGVESKPKGPGTSLRPGG